MLNVKYVDNHQSHIMCVPFEILKKNVPLELARYIREKVIESSRRGYYSTWAKKTITSHSRCIRRLQRMYRTDNMFHVKQTRRENINITKN